MSKDLPTEITDAFIEKEHPQQRADFLAYAIYGLLGGDDGSKAAMLLDKYGYTDDNGEWIGYDEGDE